VRPIVLALALAAFVGALAVSPTSAAPAATTSCNLSGSWVANNAETARYVAAINPTTTAISITSGALSATFDHGQFAFGSIGLHLKGSKGGATIKQELDIQTTAPYTTRAGQLRLGPGSFKITYISTVIKTSSGTTVPVRLPNIGNRAPRMSLAYTCTPSLLHLHVPAGAAGVTLTLRRDRG
jgi:hypothetical protein